MMASNTPAVRRHPVVWLFVLILLHMQVACSQAPATELTVIQEPSPRVAYSADPLKVMSLNIAHGRKDGMNQLLLSGDTIRANLDEIAVVLRQTGADIVALQEADAPSRWSGNFDHIALLAEEAGYSSVAETPHAQSWLFNYGTAILSRAAFTETLSYTFEPSPPTTNKGFTLAQILWQPEGTEQPPLLLDIISVHLDFSRKQVRENQISEITRAMAGRENPLIVLGDFNSDWLADELVLAALTRDNKLTGYQPSAEGLGTYISSDKRLDWILISEPLEFKSYRVLPDVISDHRVVIAEITLRTQAPATEPDIEQSNAPNGTQHANRQ